MGLVEELRRERSLGGPARRPVRSRVIEVVFRSEARRSICSATARLLRGHVPLRDRLLRWALTPSSWEALARAHADIVISTGSSSALCNIHLSRRTLARSVVIMDPGLPQGHFTAMIVPYHDKIRHGKNVYRTVAALSALAPAEVVRSGAELRRRLGLEGRAVIGFLVGGDVRGGQGLDRDGLVKTVDALLQHLRTTKSVVLITTSRRTPDWVAEILKSRFSNKEHCPLLVIVTESNPPGTMAAILGAADQVLVTAESVSMISEAVRASKPVLALHPSDSIQPKPKHRRFLQSLGARYPLIESGPSGLEQALSNLSRRRAEPASDPDRADLSAAAKAIL
ncbi:MAG: mitochondrial fission ELM1 family protein [Candidatus Eisenbacteria bacterium]|nr:mitochondrial fission ELM1 family protein [Candidatus Eisenbacteria bacterium]